MKTTQTSIVMPSHSITLRLVVIVYKGLTVERHLYVLFGEWSWSRCEWQTTKDRCMVHRNRILGSQFQYLPIFFSYVSSFLLFEIFFRVSIFFSYSSLAFHFFFPNFSQIFSENLKLSKIYELEECPLFTLFRLLDHVNSLRPSILFTMEKESNNTLPFLDVLISRTEQGFKTSVYRKPTFTGQYLNLYSHHPYSVKKGIVRCFTTSSKSHKWRPRDRIGIGQYK